MVTFIEIIDGPNAGSRFKAEDGLTLGRSSADIVIKDPKVSSTHAKFALDGKGQVVLVDLNSSNGIHIGGRRVKKVALLPGVIFELGRTQFKVVTVEESEASDFSRFLTWRTLISDKITEAMNSSEREDIQKPRSLQSFTPALKLKFVQGIQANQEWVLGYGPRKAGTNSLDLELLDLDAPNEAFELIPGAGQVSIKIKRSDKVKVNNESVDAEDLKDGDTISFGNTVITVRYL